MKQMEVTIMGQSYLLGCPEGGEAALSAAVAQVDREMSAIRDAGKVKARDRIAAQRQISDAQRRVGVERAQFDHGHLSGERRTLELHALQFSAPPRDCDEGSRNRS